MKLNLKKWSIEDGKQFYDYLESLKREDKIVWSTSILQTKKPVLALKTETIKTIVKEINSGNVKSFMDLRLFDYYESVTIYGSLLTKMQSFKELSAYLDIYLDAMDSWAHVDILSFSIFDAYIDEFLQKSKLFIIDPRPYVRRLAVFILFLLCKDKSRLHYILNELQKLNHEESYYVIMMSGWLLSELIILYRDETLALLSRHAINPKIVNKGIQKCRESRRLTQPEKDALLVYKIKR